MLFLRCASGQAYIQTRSSQYFVPLPAGDEVTVLVISGTKCHCVHVGLVFNGVAVLSLAAEGIDQVTIQGDVELHVQPLLSYRSVASLLRVLLQPIARYTLPVTARGHGCHFDTRVHGPWTRVVCTELMSDESQNPRPIHNVYPSNASTRRCMDDQADQLFRNS